MPFPGLLCLINLDQVSAGVFEYGCSRSSGIGGSCREDHALLFEALEFCIDVVDGKRRQWYSRIEQGTLIVFRCGMRIRLEKQLSAIRLLWRDDSQPPEISGRKIHFLLETKNVRIEPQCIFLISHDDAIQLNPQTVHLQSLLGDLVFHSRRPAESQDAGE